MHKKFLSNQQVEIVHSFPELLNSNFYDEINAICFERHIDGDFDEIVSQLTLKENITEISVDILNSIKLSDQGQKARGIILNDFEKLSEFGVMPSLNLLKNYERDDEFDFISTDVYSYHVDRSPFPSSTFLCTYYGAPSDILQNSQAIQKTLVPEIREKLSALFDGPESEFDTFLKDNYFDLHYQAKPNAQPTNLGLGHLWRLEVDYPNQKTLPCIHRAPIENEGELRLLLIC